MSMDCHFAGVTPKIAAAGVRGRRDGLGRRSRDAGLPAGRRRGGRRDLGLAFGAHRLGRRLRALRLPGRGIGGAMATSGSGASGAATGGGGVISTGAAFRAGPRRPARQREIGRSGVPSPVEAARSACGVEFRRVVLSSGAMSRSIAAGATGAAASSIITAAAVRSAGRLGRVMQRPGGETGVRRKRGDGGSPPRAEPCRACRRRYPGTPASAVTARSPRPRAAPPAPPARS